MSAVAQPSLKTPLHDLHLAAGARMVEFAGWQMPVMYTSIADEHAAVRSACGVFDVSHMGRLKFTGKEAATFLNRVCTRQLDENKIGKCRYSLICNPAGGVMDDVVVTKFPHYWLMVCNASNREKLVAHFQAESAGLAVTMEDQTFDTCMLAMQGPTTIELAERLIPLDLPPLKNWEAHTDAFMFIPYTFSRTGYTGEDGYEVIVNKSVIGLGWKQIVGHEENGKKVVKPCGLGARDLLRIEAALPLYGHELTEEIDPISAGLGWAVTLEKEFIGVQALREVAAAAPRRKLVGLTLEGQRIARQGCPVLVGSTPGEIVGQVTSGTLSPTVGRSIAMAYVDAAHTAPGGTLTVDIRGNMTPATVTELPFYKRLR